MIRRDGFDIGIVRKRFQLASGNRVVGSADYIQALLKLASSIGDPAVMCRRRGLPIFHDDIDACISREAPQLGGQLMVGRNQTRGREYYKKNRNSHLDHSSAKACVCPK